MSNVRRLLTTVNNYFPVAIPRSRRQQVSNVSDEPARRAASRALRCKQRWTLDVAWRQKHENGLSSEIGDKVPEGITLIFEDIRISFPHNVG